MKLTGGEIVVKKLAAEGVPYILGIPGHGVLGLFDAIRKEEAAGNIKYIQVKHEQAATAIADGYFRVKKKPLAVFASIGPGTLNLGIGLGTAYADSTSFLALCGDTHVHMSGVGVLQELERYKDSNILRSLEPLSKRVWRAESARQLSRIVSNAFREMTGGRKGPCVIALPMDVQSEYAESGGEPAAAEPSFSPSADAEAIKKAVALMKTAKRPVILAGGGAMNDGAGCCGNSSAVLLPHRLKRHGDRYKDSFVRRRYTRARHSFRRRDDLLLQKRRGVQLPGYEAHPGRYRRARARQKLRR